MSRRREELVPGQPNVIVFDRLGSSSLGPAIHIDVQTLGRLNELETLMRSLATGGSHRVLLSGLVDTHWVPPLTEVALTIAEATPDTRFEEHGEQMICKWTDSAEGWLESADKIAAMMASGNPCHQYFEGWHVDAVTIRIAFRE